MVKHARIDNRLLHGIVASQWAPKIAAQRVMIIDDEVATDEMKKGGMRLAKPAGCALSIITLETAVTNFKNHKYDGQSIFIITKSPETIVALMDAGVEIPIMNIGSTAKKDNEVKLTINSSLSKTELDICKGVMGRGVEVISQYILADSIVNLKSLVK